MVRAVLHTVAGPVNLVNASRGKTVRAERVSRSMAMSATEAGKDQVKLSG